ncbi:unnamed protein product [Protopolystoma xenopodis]|uniref:Protein kinase domain-containing protein n=1 Tax=Protopolystoma xenopodis TaxID=117903 RepID=A0A448XRZ5_9PLAT|nr:unnamed protein product [Protopolystoma xenopodis]
MSCIMEVLGVPPANLLHNSPRARHFFTSTGQPRYLLDQSSTATGPLDLMLDAPNSVHRSGGPSVGGAGRLHRSQTQVKPRSRPPGNKRGSPGSLDLVAALTSPVHSSLHGARLASKGSVDEMAEANGSLDFEPNAKLPGSSSSAAILDPDLIDFIRACLHWQPELRMTPAEAFHHPWIRKRHLPPLPGPILGQRMNGDSQGTSIYSDSPQSPGQSPFTL